MYNYWSVYSPTEHEHFARLTADAPEVFIGAHSLEYHGRSLEDDYDLECCLGEDCFWTFNVYEDDGSLAFTTRKMTLCSACDAAAEYLGIRRALVRGYNEYLYDGEWFLEEVA